MSRKLKYPKNSHQPDHAEDGEWHGLIGELLLSADRRQGQEHQIIFLRHDGRQGDEVGNDGNDVDYVHHVAQEAELSGTRDEPATRRACTLDAERDALGRAYLTINSNVNQTMQTVSIMKNGSPKSGTSSSSILVVFRVVLKICGAID